MPFTVVASDPEAGLFASASCTKAPSASMLYNDARLPMKGCVNISDVEAVHFRFRFGFQENPKTASASASASMLPGDFHENIDEVKNYTLKYFDRN